MSLQSFNLADLAALDPRTFDYLVVYSRQYPIEESWIDVTALDEFLRKVPGYHPQATQEELNDKGFRSVARWERHGQWIEIYAPTAAGK